MHITNHGDIRSYELQWAPDRPMRPMGPMRPLSPPAPWANGRGGAVWTGARWAGPGRMGGQDGRADRCVRRAALPRLHHPERGPGRAAQRRQCVRPDGGAGHDCTNHRGRRAALHRQARAERERGPTRGRSRRFVRVCSSRGRTTVRVVPVRANGRRDACHGDGRSAPVPCESSRDAARPARLLVGARR